MNDKLCGGQQLRFLHGSKRMQQMQQVKSCGQDCDRISDFDELSRVAIQNRNSPEPQALHCVRMSW